MICEDPPPCTTCGAILFSSTMTMTFLLRLLIVRLTPCLLKGLGCICAGTRPEPTPLPKNPPLINIDLTSAEPSYSFCPIGPLPPH